MADNIPPNVSCFNCNEVLPHTSEFFTEKDATKRLDSTCRKCRVQASKERYRDLCERGLCIACGVNEPDGLRRQCRLCLKNQSERMKEHRKKRNNAGICTNCWKWPIGEGLKTLCRDCADKLTVHRNKKREERIKSNVCTSCARYPPLTGYFTCRNCTDRKRRKSSNGHHKLRRLVYDAYGCKCACCGETEEKFLTLDHVENNGSEERASRGGYGIFKQSLLPENRIKYQLLCYNCNNGKHRNKGICPHKK